MLEGGSWGKGGRLTGTDLLAVGVELSTSEVRSLDLASRVCQFGVVGGLWALGRFGWVSAVLDRETASGELGGLRERLGDGFWLG